MHILSGIPFINSFEDVIRLQAKRFVESIGVHRGRSFNPFKLINLTIAGIVTRLVTGKWYGPQDEDFLGLMKSVARMFQIMGVAGLVSRVPGLSAIPSRARSELRALIRELLAFIDEAIRTHQAGFDPNKPANDFIEYYLKTMAESSAQVTMY